MKKIILALIVTLGVAEASLCQIKVLKATNQKTVAGMGGVFMKYIIEFKDKKGAVIQIDSVKSIADASTMTFFVDKNEISFGFALLPPAKCKTCVEVNPAQPNLTKGIIIYYKRGDKKSRCKVKKFVQLEDLLQP